MTVVRLAPIFDIISQREFGKKNGGMVRCPWCDGRLFEREASDTLHCVMCSRDFPGSHYVPQPRQLPKLDLAEETKIIDLVAVIGQRKALQLEE